MFSTKQIILTFGLFLIQLTFNAFLHLWNVGARLQAGVWTLGTSVLQQKSSSGANDSQFS